MLLDVIKVIGIMIIVILFLSAYDCIKAGKENKDKHTISKGITFIVIGIGFIIVVSMVISWFAPYVH